MGLPGLPAVFGTRRYDRRACGPPRGVYETKSGPVTVEVLDVDRYRRSVSRMTVDGTDVGLEMIRSGCAWHYTQYSKDARYAAAEEEPRRARRGLWQDPAPVAPWEFRRRRSAR